MKIELILSRGVQIWIDGKTVDHPWNCGERDDGLGFTFEDEGQPLHIAGLEVDGVHFDISLEEMMGGEGDPVDPEHVFLHTSDGDEHDLKVLTVDGFGDVAIKLLNGEKVTLDETMTYILAVG